jgi:deoxyribodipyrimidine photo-lyase
MRLRDNFALQTAQQKAAEQEVPLVVAFILYPHSGRRAREHYEFMLSGLHEVEDGLKQKDIPFVLLIGKGREQLSGWMGEHEPRAVVFDFSPLRGPQRLRKDIAEHADCAVVEVDTHNIVPVWAASDHQETAARTLRPKLKRLLPEYLGEAKLPQKQTLEWKGSYKTMGQLEKEIARLIGQIPANGTDISRFAPGEDAAQKAVKTFVSQRLKGYAERRNDPSQDGQSELNPYLHYGQLSSATVVRAVMEAVGQDAGLQADVDAFIEEVTVRKELSDNFCYYNQDYDKLHGAPEWARRVLEKRLDDPREFSYTRSQFENAQTHDEAWNAAERQLVRSGKMHGYMRMYWAKKVLEWSDTPQAALETLLYLNDFYHLDGGDPNGYVGILWSIAGLHDRPWGERAVYGTVRSMVYGGLKRKFDVKSYENAWPPEKS